MAAMEARTIAELDAVIDARDAMSSDGDNDPPALRDAVSAIDDWWGKF